MAYFLYGTNGIYNQANSFNYFNPSYFYPLLQSYSTMRPLIQNQSPFHFQPPYLQNSLFSTQIKVPDTKEGVSDSSEVNQQQKNKNINFQKLQRKHRNVQKQLESAKKNCESNLVNQFLSYFSSYSNSCPMIIKAFEKMNLLAKIQEKKDIEETILFFCKQISIVNSRRQRKYVNKAFLQNYFTVQKLQKYMPDILERVSKFQFLTKAQFCQLFRRCCFNFFRTVSVSSVTSSAKLNQISRPQHIKRRRLIVQALGKK